MAGSVHCVKFTLADNNGARGARNLQRALERWLVHDPFAREVVKTPEIIQGAILAHREGTCWCGDWHPTAKCVACGAERVIAGRKTPKGWMCVSCAMEAGYRV